MVRGLILAATTLVALSVAHAADLEGVSMPDARVVNGTQMRLNGIGLRTFSVLGVRISVAGLYLERPNDNAEAIIHSPTPNCWTSAFSAMWTPKPPGRHGRKAWSRIADRLAASIRTMSDVFLRRFRLCAAVMLRLCYSLQGASISLWMGGRWATLCLLTHISEALSANWYAHSPKPLVQAPSGSMSREFVRRASDCKYRRISLARPYGTPTHSVVPDRQFAELMLATFIGPEPPTPRLKRELLGLRD
jgi:hypothetical protein